jgi:hypothetical protein
MISAEEEIKIEIAPECGTDIPYDLTQKVHEFHENGFCVLENFFPNENYELLKNNCLQNFYDIQEIITERGLKFGVGLKNGYDEIVQRHPGRYEVTYQMKNIFQSMSNNSRLLELIHGILGEEIVIANESLLISESGAPVSHLFPDLLILAGHSRINLGMLMDPTSVSVSFLLLLNSFLPVFLTLFSYLTGIFCCPCV